MNSINQFIGRWVCNDCDIGEKEMKMSGNEVSWKHGGGGGPYKIKNVQHHQFEARSSKNQNIEFKYHPAQDEICVTFYYDKT